MWLAPADIVNKLASIAHALILTGFYDMVHSLQWAYGVTCWEIFSGGKVPYGGVGLTDLSQLLATGQRLEKPTNDACSDQL